MANIPTGKNIVAAQIDTDGNVIVGDGNNITVINLKEAAQYKTIEADIQKLDREFQEVKRESEQHPDLSYFKVKLLQIDEERSKKQEDLETLKQAVLKLADDFQRIPINTERLQIAKDHFEKGEFEAARAILHAEEMVNELDSLISESERLHQKTEENQQHRRDKANEFLILAHLTATDFSLPDRYEKTLEYFEQSLRAERNADNLFEIAYFLQSHNEFAADYYHEVVRLLRMLILENPVIFLPKFADALNNLAISQSRSNENDDAFENYKDALQIYASLAKENPDTYLPKFADALNNLALLHAKRQEFDEACEKYKEARRIYIDLPKNITDEYLGDIALVSNNLAILYMDNNKLSDAFKAYEFALKAREDLSRMDSDTHLPDYAVTLSNFANLQVKRNEYDDALKKYKKAVEIFECLSVENQYTNLVYLGETLSNLAHLQYIRNEYDDGLANLEKALEIFQTFALKNPKEFNSKVAKTMENIALLQNKRNKNEE